MLLDNGWMDMQGEEARIVFLSLVRSNAQGKLGFSTVENRTVVALSRAKEGLFIAGNGTLFSQHRAWDPVITMLSERYQYGTSMDLVCVNHNRRTSVEVSVWEN